MKRVMTILAVGVAGALLAGCADSYYDGDYGPGGYYYNNEGPYDVWYDGYYGAYGGGYWGDGDVFLYRDRDGNWIRDDRGHFRHERFEGAHGFRVRRP